MRLDGGNLTLTAPAPIEGYYQCIAKSRSGTALSNSSRIRKATLGNPTTATTQPRTATSGGTYSLPCALQSGQEIVPAAQYKWETVRSQSDTSPQALSLDQRLQIDSNGV